MSQLLHIIQKLSPSEKGYIVKHAFPKSIKGKQNLFEIVFNDINSKNQFDEDAIVKKYFKSKKGVEYRVFKHNLFDSIIQGLVNYNKNKSPEIKIFDNLNKAEQLINRGFGDEAKKIVEKALVSCETLNRFDLALVCLQVLRRCRVSVFITNDEWNDLLVLKNQTETNIQKLINLEEYLFCFNQIKHLESKIGHIDYSKESHIQFLSDILKQDIFSSLDKAISYEAKCLYYVCKSFYFSATQNNEARLENASLLLKHMESDSEKLEVNSSKYYHAINNYLNACFFKKHFVDFDEYILKLENSTKKAEPRQLARSFLIIQNLKMNRNFCENHPEKNIEIISHFEKDLPKHIEVLQISSFYALLTNTIITYFITHNYKKAIPFINDVLNNFDAKSHEAILCMTRIINILAHCNLNNVSLVKSLYSNYSKNLKPSSVGFETEKSVLEFASRYLKNKGKSEPEDYLNLEKILTKLIPFPSEASIIEDCCLLNWIKSKQAKVSI